MKPGEFDEYVRKEIARNAAIAKAAGIKPNETTAGGGSRPHRAAIEHSALLTTRGRTRPDRPPGVPHDPARRIGPVRVFAHSERRGG
jgi:hypothetical protein